MLNGLLFAATHFLGGKEMTTEQDRQRMAERLWAAQRELDLAVAELSAVDDSTARTLGDDGEYLEAEARELLKKVRSVACRLDRCVMNKFAN